MQALAVPLDGALAAGEAPLPGRPEQAGVGVRAVRRRLGPFLALLRRLGQEPDAEFALRPRVLVCLEFFDQGCHSTSLSVWLILPVCAVTDKVVSL